MTARNREELGRQGDELRRLLGEADQGFDHGIERVISEYDFGLIRARSMLGLREKLLVALCVAAIRGQADELTSALEASRQGGVDVEACRETLIQTSMYGGIAHIPRRLRLLRDVFGGEGMLDEATTEDWSEIEAASHDLMRELHGDRRAQGYADPERPYMSRLYQIGAIYGYGVLWRRPGLTLRERFLLVIAATTVFGAQGSPGMTLLKFARSALDGGHLSADEIAEIIIQAVPFVGFWNASSAMQHVESVLSPVYQNAD